MPPPELGSSQRRWCWTERITFVGLLVIAPTLAGIGAGWWSLLAPPLLYACGFAIDVTRHRKQDDRGLAALQAK